jgi:hypothetical protein
MGHNGSHHVLSARFNRVIDRGNEVIQGRRDNCVWGTILPPASACMLSSSVL